MLHSSTLLNHYTECNVLHYLSTIVVFSLSRFNIQRLILFIHMNVLNMETKPDRHVRLAGTMYTTKT